MASIEVFPQSWRGLGWSLELPPGEIYVQVTRTGMSPTVRGFAPNCEVEYLGVVEGGPRQANTKVFILVQGPGAVLWGDDTLAVESGGEMLADCRVGHNNQARLILLEQGGVVRTAGSFRRLEGSELVWMSKADVLRARKARKSASDSESA